MEITEIRVTLRNEDKLKAFVTVTFDKCFAVRNMKIVKGDKGAASSSARGSRSG